jgi:hypothetical protein
VWEHSDCDIFEKIQGNLSNSLSAEGVAECLIRVATNGTCGMLRESRLPLYFWAEAVKTFMYLPAEHGADKGERRGYAL